eukprot:6647484-Alexandrium_andersonii.AAC.1
MKIQKRPTQAPHLAGPIEVEPEAPNLDDPVAFPNISVQDRPVAAPPSVGRRSVIQTRSTLDHDTLQRVPVWTNRERKKQAKDRKAARAEAARASHAP